MQHDILRFVGLLSWFHSFQKYSTNGFATFKTSSLALWHSSVLISEGAADIINRLALFIPLSYESCIIHPVSPFVSPRRGSVSRLLCLLCFWGFGTFGISFPFLSSNLNLGSQYYGLQQVRTLSVSILARNVLKKRFK